MLLSPLVDTLLLLGPELTHELGFQIGARVRHCGSDLRCNGLMSSIWLLLSILSYATPPSSAVPSTPSTSKALVLILPYSSSTLAAKSAFLATDKSNTGCPRLSWILKVDAGSLGVFTG